MGIWHSVTLEPACTVGVMVVLYKAEHTPLLFTAATISSRVTAPPGGMQLEPSELRQPSSFVDEFRNSLPNNADGVRWNRPAN